MRDLIGIKPEAIQDFSSIRRRLAVYRKGKLCGIVAQADVARRDKAEPLETASSWGGLSCPIRIPAQNCFGSSTLLIEQDHGHPEKGATK